MPYKNINGEIDKPLVKRKCTCKYTLAEKDFNKIQSIMKYILCTPKNTYWLSYTKSYEQTYWKCNKNIIWLYNIVFTLSHIIYAVKKTYLQKEFLLQKYFLELKWNKTKTHPDLDIFLTKITCDFY